MFYSAFQIMDYDIDLAVMLAPNACIYVMYVKSYTCSLAAYCLRMSRDYIVFI